MFKLSSELLILKLLLVVSWLRAFEDSPGIVERSSNISIIKKRKKKRRVFLLKIII